MSHAFSIAYNICDFSNIFSVLIQLKQVAFLWYSSSFLEWKQPFGSCMHISLSPPPPSLNLLLCVWVTLWIMWLFFIKYDVKTATRSVTSIVFF